MRGHGWPRSLPRRFDGLAQHIAGNGVGKAGIGLSLSIFFGLGIFFGVDLGIFFGKGQLPVKLKAVRDDDMNCFQETIVNCIQSFAAKQYRRLTYHLP